MRIPVAVALVIATPAAGQAPDEAAQRFGALEAVSAISLSPAGDAVAFVKPRPGGQLLEIADLDGKSPPKPVMAVANQEERLERCDWITDQRLICSVYIDYNNGGQLVGVTRLLAVDRTGGNVVSLTRHPQEGTYYSTQYGGGVIDFDIPGEPGHVLMEQEFLPSGGSADPNGSNIEQKDEGLGVVDLDIATLRTRTVERGKIDAERYISDGHGTVRVACFQTSNNSGDLSGIVHCAYRKPAQRDWLDLGDRRIGAGETGFHPIAVDGARNVAYVFDDHDGRQALYTVALDGSGTRTLVLARPDVDVDGLIRVGRDRQVVGASYATDRRTDVWFDPAYQSLTAALSHALPGNPPIGIEGVSADGTKLLLVASSDVDPGRFYRFDRTTHHLGAVLPIRPQLADIAMGTMKPVTYQAADGTQIPAYLTLPPGSGDGKNLPTIVMPHGGPEARDEWGFDWLVQYFATRGYAVLQPEYRGSTGYGAQFFQNNAFKSWRTAIGDVNDAGRWLVKQGIAAPGRLAIFGWSYGGYAALQTSVLDPTLFKAIVAVAPVTDLIQLGEEKRDFTDYNIAKARIGDGPALIEGSPARNAAKIAAPVLLFSGDRDQNVNVAESRLMEARLRGAGKQVELVVFPGLDHQLMDAAARATLLAKSDAFLRHAMGM